MMSLAEVRPQDAVDAREIARLLRVTERTARKVIDAVALATGRCGTRRRSRTVLLGGLATHYGLRVEDLTGGLA